MRIARSLCCTALVAAALAACTDNRATFFVRDIKIPTTSDCEVQSDRNAAFRPYGIMDLGLTQAYYLHPLVENAMESSVRLNPSTAESNRIAVTGAQVRLRSSTGESIATDYFVPTSGLVEPGGVVATSFQAVPPGYLTAGGANDMVIVEFKMLGTTGGGIEVDTPWFAFPLYTCTGCLVMFPPEAWDEIMGCYNCWDIGSGTDDIPCVIGQDDYVDCRFCATSNEALCTDASCV